MHRGFWYFLYCFFYMAPASVALSAHMPDAPIISIGTGAYDAMQFSERDNPSSSLIAPMYRTGRWRISAHLHMEKSFLRLLHSQFLRIMWPVLRRCISREARLYGTCVISDGRYVYFALLLGWRCLLTMLPACGVGWAP